MHKGVKLEDVSEVSKVASTPPAPLGKGGESSQSPPYSRGISTV